LARGIFSSSSSQRPNSVSGSSKPSSSIALRREWIPAPTFSCHCEESFFKEGSLRKGDSSLALGAGSAISSYSLAQRGAVRLGGGRRHFAPTFQRRTPTYPICRFLRKQESIMSILMLTTKKENSAGALSPASAGRGQSPYPKCHCESFFKEGRRSNLRVLVGTKGNGEIATAFLRRASQ